MHDEDFIVDVDREVVRLHDERVFGIEVRGLGHHLWSAGIRGVMVNFLRAKRFRHIIQRYSKG